MCQNLCLLMFIYFHFECAEAERRKREEAERKAKLDEILEKQRQRERELEEKAERQKREMLARPLVEPRPVEPAVPAPIAVTTAPAPGRYVPRHRRQEAAPGQVATEPDRRGIRPDDRPALSNDRWRSDRSDERRPPSFGVGPKSTWSSSRPR